jgi:toxin ParE1/3/4
VRRLDLQPAARADLRSIYEFSVERFGRRVAETYLTGLRCAFDRVLEFPMIAPVYADVAPEIHVLHHRSHRIFYRIDGETILIVRVLHASRDSENLFRGRGR